MITLSNIHHLTPFIGALLLLIFTVLLAFMVVSEARDQAWEGVFWSGIMLLGCLAIWPVMIPVLVIAWGALKGGTW